MKNTYNVVINKKEADTTLSQRRDDYARKRDLLALEQNEAITKRIQMEKDAPGKCIKCGKEIVTENNSDVRQLCPDCY